MNSALSHVGAAKATKVYEEVNPTKRDRAAERMRGH